MTARILAEYSLVLTGRGLDPSKITRQTGLRPTRVLREGMPASRRLTSKATSWSIGIERQGSRIDDILSELVQALRPGWAELVALGQAHPAYVSVSVTVDDQIPSLAIPASTLRELAVLNAWLDIDILADLVSDPAPRRAS